MKRSRHDGVAATSGPWILRWRAPMVMVSSLLVGVALAIGHHAFYASLAGTSVSSAPIRLAGWKTTQQQINIAIGTAFAFVVKASLILACSTAYMQLLFGALNRKALRIEVLDDWFGALGDIWSFACTATHWKYPLLTLGALTCWLLPIAAIISPTALSVVFDRTQPSPVRSEFVPQPAFSSLAFSLLYMLDYRPRRHQVQLTGPVEEVTRLAWASAASGSILPIVPPGINATWETSFDAPRLACEDIEGDLRQNIKENLQFIVESVSVGQSGGVDQVMFSYLGWTAFSNDTDLLPFRRDKLTDNWKLQSEPSTPYFTGVGIDIFFGLFPRQAIARGIFGYGLNTSSIVSSNGSNMTLMDWYFEDATLLHCRVIPTTYELGFSYSGVNQEQNIKIISSKDAPEATVNTTVLQIQAPGSLPIIVSVEGRQDVQLAATNITDGARQTMQLISYAAIQQAAHGILLGAANTASSVRMSGASLNYNRATANWANYQANVFSTILSKTRELSAAELDQPTASAITNATSGMNFNEAISLLPIRADENARPFREAVTELYFNITLSMASSTKLTYNESSPLAPEKVEVTYALYGNVYSYATDKLCLAYGIAVGVTALNVLIGLIAIFRAGASYTENFSTIVRTARNAAIEVNMMEHHLPGSDPLPRKIAKAELLLRKAGSVAEDRSLVSVSVTEIGERSRVST